MNILKRINHKWFGTLAVIFISANLYATNYTSTNSGDWYTTSNWSPVGVPGAGDVVTIKHNIVLTLVSNMSVASIGNASNAGSLIVNTTGDYTLTVTGDVNFKGGNTAIGVQFADDVNINIGGLVTIDQTNLTIGDNAIVTTGYSGTSPSLVLKDVDLTLGTNVDFTVNNNMTISNSAHVIIPAGSELEVTGELKFDGGGSLFEVSGSLVANSINLTAGQQDFKVLDGGVVTVTTNVSTSGTAALSIENNGTFDVGNNMTIDGAGVTIDGVLNVANVLNVTNGGNDVTGDGIVTAGSYTGTGKIFGSTSSGLTGSVSYTNTGTGAAVPLPIELTFFNAVLTNGNVLITWQTASEENNDFFTIERSVDGVNFEGIGTIAGEGNSSVAIDYNFVDNNAIPGVSYYRLKQTDYDGAFAVFDMVAIDNGSVANKNATVGVLHNQQVLNFTFSDYQQNVYFNVYDIIGRMVSNDYFVNVKQIELDKNNLPSGIYIVKIYNMNGLNYSERVKF